MSWFFRTILLAVARFIFVRVLQEIIYCYKYIYISYFYCILPTISHVFWKYFRIAKLLKKYFLYIESFNKVKRFLQAMFVYFSWFHCVSSDSKTWPRIKKCYLFSSLLCGDICENYKFKKILVSQKICRNFLEMVGNNL